jgi:hypothetical protein
MVLLMNTSNQSTTLLATARAATEEEAIEIGFRAALAAQLALNVLLMDGPVMETELVSELDRLFVENPQAVIENYVTSQWLIRLSVGQETYIELDEGEPITCTLMVEVRPIP